MKNKEKMSFKLSELEEFDGKEGKPTYIALKGKVYTLQRVVSGKVVSI